MKHKLLAYATTFFLLSGMSAIAEQKRLSDSLNDIASEQKEVCFVKDPSRINFVESVQDDSFLFKDILWEKQAQNQWLSSENIVLNIYSEAESNNVASSFFWKSYHALEAYEILEFLKKFNSSQEINVTEFFRRSGDYAWSIKQPSRLCEDCRPQRYRIHYLYSSTEDWIINHLMAHGKGYVDSRRDDNGSFNSYIYFTSFGPYEILLEGSFKIDSQTFWFSASNPQPMQPWWTFVDGRQGEEPEVLSSQERIEIFQDIDNFIQTCMTPH